MASRSAPLPDRGDLRPQCCRPGRGLGEQAAPPAASTASTVGRAREQHEGRVVQPRSGGR